MKFFIDILNKIVKTKLKFSILFIAVTSDIGYGGSYGGCDSCTFEPIYGINEVVCNVKCCTKKVA